MSSYREDFSDCGDNECREIEDCGDCDQEKEGFFGFRSKKGGFFTVIVYIIIVVALAFYIMKFAGLSDIHPIVKMAVGFRDILLLIAAVMMIIF